MKRTRTTGRRRSTPALAVMLTVAGLTLIGPPASGAGLAAGAAPTTGTVVADDLPLAGDAAAIYLGDWSTRRNTGSYRGADQLATSAESSVSVLFTGTGVRLYGSTGASFGRAAFTVDDGAPSTVDLYSATPSDQTLLFAVADLPLGPHTVRMRNTGQKGPAATGTTVGLDRFDVTTTPAPSPVSTAGFVTKSGNQLQLGGRPFRFAGANLYWLGLDDNLTDAGGPTYPTRFRIDSGLQGAKSAGLTVIRSHTLGISVGCARCLEPSLGRFNDDALQSADYALYRAGQLGLKVMIPLTDQWRWYHGGMSTFTGWRGYPNIGSSTNNVVNAANNRAQRDAEAHFYTDPTVAADFKQYVTHLLQHVNPYTGLAYKDDPTIMAWETGNEIWTANPTWTQDLAWFIKHTVGAKQLVADGTAATGMRVAAAAVDAPDVDILGGHFYPVDTEWMEQDAAVAAAHGKAYVIGEYAWTDPIATSTQISAVEGNPDIAGDLLWTLMPYKEDGSPEVHGDGYAIYSPATTPVMAAVMVTVSRHARLMTRS